MYCCLISGNLESLFFLNWETVSDRFVENHLSLIHFLWKAIWQKIVHCFREWLWRGSVARMLILLQCVLKLAVLFQVSKTSAEKYPSNERLELDKLIYFESVQSQPHQKLFHVMLNLLKVWLFSQGRFLQKHPPQELNQCDQVSGKVDPRKQKCDDRRINWCQHLALEYFVLIWEEQKLRHALGWQKNFHLEIYGTGACTCFTI